jgi:DNA-binding NtrC family response regulator
VDESSGLPATLRALLARDHDRAIDLVAASSGAEIMEAMAEVRPSLIFLAIDLEGTDGLELLDRLRERHPTVPVVLVAGRDDLEVAIRAMQHGASDFLVRPVRKEALADLLRRHLEQSSDHEELASGPEVGGEEDRLLGRSPAIIEVCKTIGRVAPTDATVLISGESGTGKELIAGLIHKNSQRWERPFRTINCAAIPENLVESELFGHEKGSFTGASSRHVGKFEAADGGTLFLDEIGDMSLAHQKKILRALEEGVIERVGGREQIPVDVRVVAATHVDLWQRVKDETFRRDLYYRLAVVNLRVPPLRERKEDIRLLTDHFVTRFARRSGRPVRRIASEVHARLRRYDWPGNVRELRNVLERAVIMGQGEVLEVGDLPDLQPGPRPGTRPRRTLRRFCQEGVSLESLERRYIESVLEEHGWHFGDAADVLQIHRNTLRRKIRRYEIEDPGSEQKKSATQG